MDTVFPNILIVGHQKAAAVSIQPAVTLRHWALVKAGCERLLIGFADETGGKIRTSTCISEVRPKAREVVTTSGRVYRLAGPRGPGERMAQIWSAIEAEPCFDVTDQLEAMLGDSN